MGPIAVIGPVLNGPLVQAPASPAEQALPDLLAVEFGGEMRQSITMQQQTPKNKVIQDEWGTTTREAYEDRPVFQQPRKKTPPRKGSGSVKSLGGLLILGGIFWGTYLVTSGTPPAELWKMSGPGPLCIFGVVVSILGKYLR